MHTLQNIVDYAARHHYNLSFSRPVDAHRAPAWNKVKAWEALLREHDWVWQSDQDMLVMNLHQRLETFVDDSYDIIVGRDCVVFDVLRTSGKSESDASRLAFNSGSFFLKSSAWTLEFLGKVWPANGSDVEHVDYWWEQAAMMHVIAADPSASKHVKIVPGRDFNAWPQNRQGVFLGVDPIACEYLTSVFYQPGDFAVHFVGSEAKAELASFAER